MAWSLLASASGVALLLWALSAFRAPLAATRVPTRAYLLPLSCFAILFGWLIVQTSTLTPQDWHHPDWQAAADALSGPLEGSIATDPAAAGSAMLRLASYGAVFFLAMQFGAFRRQRRRLTFALAVSGVGYALYGLVIQFGGYDHILWYPRWAYHDSLSATFVNRNSFATYAGLILIVLLGIIGRTIAEPTQVERHSSPGQAQRLNDLAGKLFLPIMGLIVVFMALLLSQSRGGLIATLLALTVLPRYGAMRRRSTAVAAFGIAAVLAVVLVLGAGQTLRRLDEEGAKSALARAVIYEAVADGIADRPWLGHGYGSFKAVFPRYRGPDLIHTAVVDKAHNTYLEFAFEAGLPATALALLILAAIVHQCYRSTRFDSRAASSSRCALAAAVLVGSHSMIDFSVQIPAVAVLFAALLGLGVGAGFGRQSTTS